MGRLKIASLRPILTILRCAKPFKSYHTPGEAQIHVLASTNRNTFGFSAWINCDAVGTQAKHAEKLIHSLALGNEYVAYVDAIG
jgi:hypothetical protein